MKKDDADEVDLDNKAEVILKSALVTDDQSSDEDEDTEPQLAPPAADVAELEQEQLTQPLPPPVVNFDFEQQVQVQPAVNRLNALDYPEDSGNADSSAPSSLESQSGPGIFTFSRKKKKFCFVFLQI